MLTLMANAAWTGGRPLDETTAERLRALLRKHGNEKKVAELLDVHPINVLRGAAGVGLRKGTQALIEHALATKAA